MPNALYYGDNLDVLRNSVPSESVDLIYLDPPFNSNASYNVLFRSPTGTGSAAQIEAFEDTWHWNETAERAFDDVMVGPNSDAAIMLRAMRAALGENDMMAYLAMMAVRLLELRRALKPTGSLYLHCDPSASHYLKMILDAVFGATNFRNEIIWKRTHSHGDPSRKFGAITDTILFYTASDRYEFESQFRDMPPEQIERTFRGVDPDGRRWQSVTLRSPSPRPNLTFPFTASSGVTYQPHPNGWSGDRARMAKYDAEGRLHYPSKPDGALRLKMYLDESSGVKVQNLWDDIPPISANANERLGYPTQKPVDQLERIVSASSSPGDTVLDPFCGCGTAVHAAQKLGRHWVGIDVTHLAVSLVESRLQHAFPGIVYEVHGVPKDADGAANLAQRDKHEFQKWITGRVGAQPYKGGKKGMDRGVDGYLHFRDADQKPQFAIVSVKGGGTKSGDVRDLKGTVDREKAAMGLFLTLHEPTREMVREAAAANFYETGGMRFPKVQILTAAEIIAGKRPQVPFGFTEGFKKAAREASTAQSKMKL